MLRQLHTVPTRYSSKKCITIIARSSPNVSVDLTVSLTHTSNIRNVIESVLILGIILD